MKTIVVARRSRYRCLSAGAEVAGGRQRPVENELGLHFDAQALGGHRATAQSVAESQGLRCMPPVPPPLPPGWSSVSMTCARLPTLSIFLKTTLPAPSYIEGHYQLSIA